MYLYFTLRLLVMWWVLKLRRFLRLQPIVLVPLTRTFALHSSHSSSSKLTPSLYYPIQSDLTTQHTTTATLFISKRARTPKPRYNACR